MMKRRDEKITELTKIYSAIDGEILAKANIIGMTTTGVAKLNELIQAIGPKVFFFNDLFDLSICIKSQII